MIPLFDEPGNVPPGIHEATWDEIAIDLERLRSGRALLAGLRPALQALQTAGCRTVDIDGSFVTAKRVPNDFDVCCDIESVNAISTSRTSNTINLVQGG